MRQIFRLIGRKAYEVREFYKLGQIYKRYSAFTMIDKYTYIKNLEIADSCRRVPGCVVECGVWRGGMSAGLADVLGPDREFFLFDSFEGLPPAEKIDGPAALRWQADIESPKYYDNCTAAADDARSAMSLSAAAHFSPLKGWFHETLPRFRPPEPIALLRLDGDWYESTLICLKHLYPQLAPGGIAIIDDYDPWDGCERAVHEFLFGHASGEVPRIRQYKNDVYFIVKPREVSESAVLDRPAPCQEEVR
jgi:O-methyltransferase